MGSGDNHVLFALRPSNKTNSLGIRFNMMRPALALLFAVLSLAAPLATRRAIANPEIPGKPQGRPIAIVGGMVHTVSGATIDGGMVVFDKGKITAVGKDAPIPADAPAARPVIAMTANAR